MARKAAPKTKKKEVADYRHEDATRLNNPTAPLARDDVGETPKRRFEFDPHLDPQLVWAGKAEQTELEVDAPTLHIHERISTEAIIRHAQREEPQISLFADPELERSKAIEFYEHEMGWANRLILGDSLHVMTSLLERERMAGQVQMIYIDPPYGINYNSNFQARISNRSPREASDDAVTREPEMIQAYRDTWELGVHSYLAYLRGRLVAARELLTDSGSVFVQIGIDNVHLVRTLLDEVFGRENACPMITVQKTSGHDSRLLPEVCDYLVWYARDAGGVKYRALFQEKGSGGDAYRHVELPGGERRAMTAEERAHPALLPEGSRIFRYDQILAGGSSRRFAFDFEGREFRPAAGNQWKIRAEGMKGLADAGRLGVVGNTLSYIRYLDDFGGVRRTNVWTDTGQAGFVERKKAYVVETNPKIVERCLAMTTDPGDLVLDPTCGSGTTAMVAEKHGRRWITIDTSRVALSLARERILTAKYDYFALVDPARGVDGGLKYASQRRVTASSIGYGHEPDVEVFYDRPVVDRSRVRVSGPFTVEALSRYSENPADGVPSSEEATATGGHVAVLLAALRANGIPRRRSKPLKVASLDPISGSGALQAEGTYERDGETRTFAVSMGPRYGPITQIQIDEALDERAGYDLVCFAGFAATAEAQAYLAPGKRGKVEVALLEANADLLLGDLLKNTTASQTFRLFAAPDAEIERGKDGEVAVRLLGMDSYDAATGEVLSRGQDEIAAWFLDHDYDGSCFHVNQAFFTRANAWEALGKALKGTVDPEALEQLSGFASLPFKPGESKKCAIRVVDDAGQTSEAILPLA